MFIFKRVQATAFKCTKLHYITTVENITDNKVKEIFALFVQRPFNANNAIKQLAQQLMATKSFILILNTFITYNA